jgi:transposase
MKYTKSERLVIGKRIYDGALTKEAAAETYDINVYTARDYLREYKASINVSIPQRPDPKRSEPIDLNNPDYEHMTKEELLDELIKSKINEARAKKGYIVKGDGANKEFIPLSSKNSK